jgi:hypothetical protein
MSNRFFISCSLLAASAVFATAQTSFPYSTSFENFNVGGIAGQNGWSASSSATYQVVNTSDMVSVARTGNQSVRWSGTAGTWAWIEYDPVAMGAVQTSVWVHIASGDSTRRFGMQAWGTNLGYNPAITVRPDGQIWAQTTTATQVFTGSTLANPLGRWIELMLNVDTVTGAVSASADGQGFVLPNLTGSGTRSILDVDLYATGTGGATAYFDDYAAVPEPATMLALAAGAGALVARRRRTKK